MLRASGVLKLSPGVSVLTKRGSLREISAKSFAHWPLCLYEEVFVLFAENSRKWMGALDALVTTILMLGALGSMNALEAG